MNNLGLDTGGYPVNITESVRVRKKVVECDIVDDD